ncbi:hypothetical protein [Bacteroides ihuae]|uniref:hypothetical protein n=1 Tax=Bacteroides ihuae TaxID=1852362 RepID=UPI0008DAEE00|nr:hypothetical protein [Bacteroides ihuae]
MKRTTYIIIGTLFFFMIVMLAAIYYSWSGGYWNYSELRFSKVLTEKNISGIRVLRILRTDENQRGFMDGTVQVVSPLATDENSLYYSKDLSKYMTATTSGDTLTLNINFSKDVLPKELVNKDVFFPRGINFRVAADSTLKIISSSVDGLNLKVLGLKRDTMSFSFRGHMSADSCSFRSVAFSGAYYSYTKLKIRKSNISNLYMKADDLNWTIENSHIVTEYISGERSESAHTWAKGECNKIVWQPKTIEAKLSVVLDGETSVSFL